MFDIDFYMKSYDFMQEAGKGKIRDCEYVLEFLESIRSKAPVVYNIETTNACNMRCEMCPRTTMMTRPVQTMGVDLFSKIMDQLKPHRKNKWEAWERFVQGKYGIGPTDTSENHFFLYIIPKVIQLHGYGDPLLDKNMGAFVKTLADRGFYSYFSCNPANIDIAKTLEMFENGLNYIKYSVESINDERHKEIRGNASNFTDSYHNILKILDIKKKRGLKTVVIITMLDLNKEWQKTDFIKLKSLFVDKDVYIYMKSEDQQWYREDYHGTNSVHWSEFCKHPWMSMTIKSNGEAAMCMEDYNNEIVLGDTKKELLADIWNSKRYAAFRRNHVELPKGIKCTERCDMRLIGEYLV
ncbi:MAG: radical SAM/SPASM domain-containing protein [Syntrophales bacterium]